MNRCITFSSFLYGLSMATDSRNAPRCDAMIGHLPRPSYTSPHKRLYVICSHFKPLANPIPNFLEKLRWRIINIVGGLVNFFVCDRCRGNQLYGLYI
jgi:hypothetical protein